MAGILRTFSNTPPVG